MKKTWRRIGLYVLSVGTGYFLLSKATPIMALWAVPYLPWSTPDDMQQSGFMYYYLICAVLTWIAISLAVLPAFWIWSNALLRRVALTMPLWVGMLYAQLYLIFMMWR